MPLHLLSTTFSLGTRTKKQPILKNDTIRQGKILHNFQLTYKLLVYMSTGSVCIYFIIIDEQRFMLLSDNFEKFWCHRLEIDACLIKHMGSQYLATFEWVPLAHNCSSMIVLNLWLCIYHMFNNWAFCLYDIWNAYFRSCRQKHGSIPKMRQILLLSWLFAFLMLYNRLIKARYAYD